MKKLSPEELSELRKLEHSMDSAVKLIEQQGRLIRESRAVAALILAEHQIGDRVIRTLRGKDETFEVDRHELLHVIGRIESASVVYFGRKVRVNGELAQREEQLYGLGDKTNPYWRPAPQGETQ